MKKIILLIFLFSSVTFFGQISGLNQPTVNNKVCDDNNDGFASFSMTAISGEIVGQITPNYLVTHHLSQNDATTGANPLPSTFINTVANTQVIFAKVINITNNLTQIVTYNLIVNPRPAVITFSTNICDNDGTPNGITTTSPLSSFNPNFSNNNQFVISYFRSQADALANTNAIIQTTPYTNSIPNQEVLFVRVQSSTGCFSVSQLVLVVQSCLVVCTSPTTLSSSNATATSVVLNWLGSSASNQYEVYISAPGTPAPSATTQGIIATTTPFVLSNLNCGTPYTIYVRTVCGNNGNSAWTAPITITTLPCGPAIGQPTNLTQCQNNGQACFNLTSNTSIILANLNPATYSVSYFTSQANATNNTNVITNPSQYCITTASQVIFARVTNTVDNTFQVVGFSLVASEYETTVRNLTDMTQCDDNNDTVVTFNLTTAQAQINSTYVLEYYTSLANAQNRVVPVANPDVFNVGTQSPSTAIFVREINPTTCDRIYKFNAIAYAVCNNAYVCNTANSLCSALGVPFANTHQGIQAQAGNSYGCLGTRPNPTWFYLPISRAGNINLMIQQSTDISFVNTAGSLDVDYICYGPFTNPTTPCNGQLTADKIVSCSFSASANEYPVIPNAQPGQYYLIMTTNFSNRAGFIKITEMSSTVGAINCSGLRLNAFLDMNSNGTQDTGEQNFPLGQFHYEMNQNGNPYHLIAPSGVYNIYDINPANSYNLSYTINSNYTANYSVNPASYSNVNVVVGSGMQVYNFPVRVTNNYADVATILVPTRQPRPGFTYTNRIIYTNLGTQTVASGTLSFTKDARVTITANSQTGTVTTPTGFTYNFTNLLPFEIRTINVTMQVPTIPTVALGNLLTNSVSITPLTGDVVPANNAASISQTVIGSYDPNDKMEARGEQILHSSFTANDFLTYTIRFENTGTASAINVRVNDVLDSKLDETSIKMESASHSYVMDRIGNNINWRFDDIELPATITNPIASNGYIQFKIKPKPGYAIGDIIPNTAAIYFDFNPPIITNTFQTRFVTVLALDEFENGSFVFYPNPASDFVTITLKDSTNSLSILTVYDVMGKMILQKKTIGTITSYTIDLSSVNPGIYFIEVQTENNTKVVKKLLVK
ncbi:MAG: T9SS type A sorting domain-containing protein [Flavobacterium sp.]|nr:T9SS type A sorting domain-containing protein [Flavobacterium sp.]